MFFLRFTPILLSVCLAFTFSANTYAKDAEKEAVVSTADSQDTRQADQLLAGIALMQKGKKDEAISVFDKVIANYQERFNDPKTAYFSARTMQEKMMYAGEGANKKEGVALVSENWSNAYYLKGYTLIDLKRTDDAMASFGNAVAMSPRNSHYLSELANLYADLHDWDKSLTVFQQAEAAVEFSPSDIKNSELARAWRGIGYVLVEQNKLDEAEGMYLKCLELNKSDLKAIGELAYVQDLKKKQK